MITKFDFENHFLSNFYITPVFYRGTEYPSTEHAYQAAKTLDTTQQEKIRLAATPGIAKRLGRKVTMREDWDSVKLGVMWVLLDQKFDNPELGRKLLDTGDEELVEGNWWGDTFWGVCKGVGENHLGKLLMKKRGLLRQSLQSTSTTR